MKKNNQQQKVYFMIDSLVVTVNYHEAKKGRKLEHSAPDLEVKDNFLFNLGPVTNTNTWGLFF